MKLQKQNIPFTMVANAVLMDTKISWKAKGIFAYLFSKPDGWDFSADRIKNDGNGSRSAVLAALKELENAGLLKRNRLASGRVDYVLAFAESQSTETVLGLSDPKSSFRTVRKPHGAKTDPVSKKENPSNTEVEVISKGANDIPEIIDLFKEVNPSYQRLFGNKTQRVAVERMLKTHGKERLVGIVRFLPKSNASQYAPTITTPHELEVNLGRLVAWGQRQKERKPTAFTL